MVELVIGFVAGLLVGWLFLPAPQWVTDLYARWSGKA